jgi:chemotaxis protein methyltransferase CheR
MGNLLTVPVSAKNHQNRTKQYSLSNSEFKFICQLVYDSSGIVLDERKREMLYRRLMRRTRDLGLSSFSEYCQLLKSGSEDEFPQFINAITTNLTSFFRESHHFDYLRKNFIPEMLRQNRSTPNKQSNRLRIWSSACSTGEEPYSIAITLIQAMGSALVNWDARILATDLDSDVIATAKSGIYKNERLEELDEKMQKKWFHKGSGGNSGLAKVDPRLPALITFKQLNLLESWPMNGPFDIIFCRNVLIYFDTETQGNLISRYRELLKPGGILFLGHSENIPKDQAQFEFMGRTIFRKPLTTENSRVDW